MLGKCMQKKEPKSFGQMSILWASPRQFFFQNIFVWPCTKKICQETCTKRLGFGKTGKIAKFLALSKILMKNSEEKLSQTFDIQTLKISIKLYSQLFCKTEGNLWKRDIFEKVSLIYQQFVLQNCLYFYIFLRSTCDANLSIELKRFWLKKLS